MRTVFMGTPAIAASALASLINSKHSVEAVVTRPDAVSGRGKSVHFSPVKELALEHGIKVLHPAVMVEVVFLSILSLTGRQHLMASFMVDPN